MRHRVGIRDLRDALSRWLEKGKRGDEVVVTDHGRPVAVLAPMREPRKARTVEEHLANLEARGLLVRGNGKGWQPRKPIRIPGLNLTRAILEDREDRV